MEALYKGGTFCSLSCYTSLFSSLSLMAKSRLMLAVFLLLLFVELDVFSGPCVKGVEGIDCAAKCDYRCSKASRHKMCIRACNTCCHRCNCVPPGTSGNTDMCPCYAHMTTHGGRLKCP